MVDNRVIVERFKAEGLSVNLDGSRFLQQTLSATPAHKRTDRLDAIVRAIPKHARE